MKVDNYPEEKMSYGTKFSDNILDDPKYLYVGNNSKLILLDWFMFPSLWHYELFVISGGVLSHHIFFLCQHLNKKCKGNSFIYSLPLIMFC